jgi:hypothetical protein
MRYLGLNIRIPESGKYQDQYKVAEKGMPLGRNPVFMADIII